MTEIGENAVDKNDNQKLIKQVNWDVQRMVILVLAIRVPFQGFLFIKNVLFERSFFFKVLLNSIVSLGTENNGDKEKHYQTYCVRCLGVIVKIWIPSLRKFIQQHWENGNVKKRKNVWKDKISIN